MATTPPVSPPGRRIQTRRSGVHGKGVFALQEIPKGDAVIEYVGEIITWKEADRRHPHDPLDPNHTFYFHLDDEHVIDALYGGNSSRWINHACEPNCEADVEDGRVFIKTLRSIHPGEELNYDYGLVIDGKLTKSLRAEYACWCGAPSCRGTMLSLVDKKKQKSKKKKAGKKRQDGPKAQRKAKAKAQNKQNDRPKGEGKGKGKADNKAGQPKTPTQRKPTSPSQRT